MNSSRLLCGMRPRPSAVTVRLRMIVIHRLVTQVDSLCDVDGLLVGDCMAPSHKRQPGRYPGPFVKLPDHSSLMACSLSRLGSMSNWISVSPLAEVCLDQPVKFLRLAPRGSKCRHHDSTLSAWCQDRSEERHPGAFSPSKKLRLSCI